MAKTRLVNWGLVEDSNELYNLVQELITKYHGGDKGIDGISFVLMWRFNIKPDPDGFVWLADITRSADKYRELRPHDVIIGINKDAWSVLDGMQKQAVIGYQLERVAVRLDKQGEIKEDDLGRVIYRLRNPQTVDDEPIRRRYGTTMSEIHEYVADKFGCQAEEGSYVDEQLNP